jgi:hypothetical protein
MMSSFSSMRVSGWVTAALLLSLVACQGGEVFIDPDPDNDGLTNAEEEVLGTDPNNPDTDGDGLNDGTEVRQYRTDPLNPDTDGDGLSDGDEVSSATDPLNPDTDGGGMLDGEEVRQGRNPNDPRDDGDFDRDGLNDLEEAELGTDPRNPDTDGDGLDDYTEVRRTFTDPLNPDTDGDGLTDREEVQDHRTDPNNPDTDGDTLTDGEEVQTHGTDPRRADTDGDGLTDGDELTLYGSSPLLLDTDGDTLTDGREVLIAGSDPTLVDTDEDGLTDAQEYAWGTNPRRADTDGDELSDYDEIFVWGTNPLLSDTDSDGIPDGIEVLGTEGLEPYGPTDPLNPDTDGDDLPDGLELVWSANPLVRDSDGDGLLDGEEVYDHRTDPSRADSDDDGLADGEELRLGTDPRNRDTDSDGLDDGQEIRGMEVELPDGRRVTYFSDPLRADTDGDGIVDLQEVFRFFTDPRLADTDGDGLTDQQEIQWRFDPLVGGDGEADADADGLSNREEILLGLNPRRADTDNDGLSDGDELLAATDPFLPDTDGDGVIDGDEVAYGLDPNHPDTDRDGIPDGQERANLIDLNGNGLVGAADPDMDGDGLLDTDELRLYGTDERVFDTDGDGIPDGTEVRWGLNPLDPADGALDLDGDGVSNVSEYRYRGDARLIDTDGDGIPDGVELEAGLNMADPTDADEDFDGDGLTNREELCPQGIVGATCPGERTDIRSADSDADGLPDGMDTAPNNPDRDGDGLLDGEEVFRWNTNPDEGDSDGDGLPDNLEIVGGADPWNNDSDGDGLEDSEELELGTDPRNPDTDGDGLTDFQETRQGFLVRVYGEERSVTVFTDPLLADTDGDGVPDNLELSLGLNPRLPDTDGDGLTDGEELDLGTDPFQVDSDRDGIPDGVDPAPRSRDADQDGIPDQAEFVAGYHGFMERPMAAAPLARTFNLESAQPGWYRVSVAARPGQLDPTRRGGEPEVTLSVRVNGTDRSVSRHALRWQGNRLLSSAPLRLAGGSVEVGLDNPSGDVTVEHIVLEFIPHAGTAPPFRSLPTFADVADSDEDGLDDATEAGAGQWFVQVDPATGARSERYERGFWSDLNDNGVPEPGEFTPGFWLEAEHSADATLVRQADPGAGNGVAVLAELQRQAFATGAGAWGYLPNARYSVFVRARALGTSPAEIDVRGCTNDCPNYLFVTVNRGNNAARDCGLAVCSTRIGLSDRWEWHYAGTYTPGSQFDIRISEQVRNTNLWALDRVAVLPMEFTPDLGVQVVNAALPVERRRPEIPADGVLRFDLDLPWGLSDPAEADTDGDGYRSVPAGCQGDGRCQDGLLAGSIGWLTDGFELQVLGTNPFDIDSDHDADLLPALLGVFGGDAFFDLFGGETFSRWTDDRDPWPVSADNDLDGLSDALEEDALAFCLANPGTPGRCPSASAILSACQRVYAVSGMLCWSSDDDRDNDGIPDGLEDRNQNGVVDPGETDPNNPDTDGDGIPDGVELGLAAPQSRNFRQDRNFPTFVPDAQPGSRTNPLSRDTDGDGIDDGLEDLNRDGAYVPGTCLTGLDDVYPACPARTVEHPSVPGLTLTYTSPIRQICETNPADIDSDGDGLTDFEEIFIYCTSPYDEDSDGDGLDDGIEVLQLRTDPNSRDTDGDGLTDFEEVNLLLGVLTSDPLRADTDGDGLNDFEELRGPFPSDPNVADTDGDGLSDFEEVRGTPATNPRRVDTDGDGLTDFFEQYGEDTNRNGRLEATEDRNQNGVLDVPRTNPIAPDTDGDGFRDGEEWRAGTDPLDPTSFPTTLSDAGGVEIGNGDSDLVFELDPDTGERTGIVSVSGSRVEFSCPGRAVTGWLDGTLRIDRTDPSGRQVVTAAGDFYAALYGGLGMKLWSGETEIVGYDEVTGEPTLTTLARSPAGVRPDVLRFGRGATAEMSFDLGAFYDLCNGDIGGLADWYLGNDAWRLGARSEVAVRPRSLGFTVRGRIGLDTPIGTVWLTNTELEASLLEFYVEGRAGMEIPSLGDLAKLFPGPEEVQADSTTCPVCVDFLIDPLNGRFRFLPSIGYEMSIGPLTASVDGPSLPSFEVDIPRGYFYIEGGFEVKNLSISGKFAFDLAGQLEFERASTPRERTCSTDDDCRYGETCSDENVCLGCAARFQDVIKPRFNVTFEGEGRLSDQFAVTVRGDYYRCPGGGVDCNEDTRILDRSYDRTFRVVQNSRLNPRRLAAAMADTINQATVQGCDGGCGDAEIDCRIFACPPICRFDPFGSACRSCVGTACDGARAVCEATCEDALPVQAFANDNVVVIDSDSLLFDMEVIATFNNVANESVLSAEQAELVNGHLVIAADVSIPLKNPVLALEVGGDLFADIFPTTYDGDPNFFAVNGRFGLGASLGPVGLSFELGRATTILALDESDDLNYMVISTDTGMRLDDLVSGLPMGLGNIGSGTSMTLGYDNQTMTLCGEAEYNTLGFIIPMAFSIAPPLNPTTFAFDPSLGGLSASFGLELPLWFGSAFGFGSIGWDGQFEFGANLDIELLPGMNLAQGRFLVNNDGVFLSGRLDLPLGLGFLRAEGQLTVDGQFSLDLEGELSLAGFRMASVRGTIDNSGVYLFGEIRLPGNLAVVQVEGWIRSDGSFRFSGLAEINIPGGTRLAGARIVIDNRGLEIDANLTIPGITDIVVKGRIFSDGYILLTASASFGIGDGLRVGPISLTFERTAAGQITISGTGAMTIAGRNIASLEFSISTSGAFRASGRIHIFVATIQCTIERTTSGQINFVASVEVRACAFEHCASGRIEVALQGGVFSFYIGARVSGPVVNFSFGVGVDSRGCFRVDGLGTFCL